jgi:glutamate racemase
MGPIGIFDSGYGGLTVLKEIREILPEYDYIYLGDNARAPYGDRSFELVHEFTLQAVKYLFDKGCPLVILACNTASAKALRNIQQNYLSIHAPSKRVLGVIRPTTEEIGTYTKTNCVGVLGTKGTVNSESYLIELNKFFPELKVYQQACPLWVPIIENGAQNTTAGRLIIENDIKTLLKKNKDIDTIILACTHYPIIEETIKEFVGKDVTILSQGPLTAQKLKKYLKRHESIQKSLSKNGKVVYFTSENPITFDVHAQQILGAEIQSKQAVW